YRHKKERQANDQRPCGGMDKFCVRCVWVEGINRYDTEQRDNKANQQGACIAHKDFGGGYIILQEPDDAAQQAEGQAGSAGMSESRQRYAQRKGGYYGNRTGKSVNTI